MKREELLAGLTKEQIERLNECNSPEEILNLAKEEDVELNDEQLKAISGGCGSDEPKYPAPKPMPCPHCNSLKQEFHLREGTNNVVDYHCLNCGGFWNIPLYPIK